MSSPPRKRLKYYIILESESSESEIDRPESIRSLQGYETELVIDTPDTESKSEEYDSEVHFEIEYDIQTQSSTGNYDENEGMGILVDSSERDEDFRVIASGVAAVLTDIGVRATIRRTCIQCNLPIDNSLTFCKKCFQAKKMFYPPRPRGYKKKDGVILKHSDTNSSYDSSSEEDLNQELEQSQPNNSVLDDKELCIMCNAVSRNAVFVHGSTGHMVCCYQCALRTWTKYKKCPVCNRKANNVIKIYK